MENVHLTFLTKDDFNTALTSSSSELYKLMRGVTSENPSISIICFIKDTSEIITCGTNIIIDTKHAIPGDYIFYDIENNKFFACCNRYIIEGFEMPTKQTTIVNQSVFNSEKILFHGIVISKNDKKLRLYHKYVTKKRADVFNITFLNGITLNDTSSILDHGTSPLFVANIWNNNDWISYSRWNTALENGAEEVNNGYASTSSEYISIKLSDYNYSYDEYIKTILVKKDGLFLNDGFTDTITIVKKSNEFISEGIAFTEHPAIEVYNYNLGIDVIKKYKFFMPSVKDVDDICKLFYIPTFKNLIGNSDPEKNCNIASTTIKNGAVLCFGHHKYYNDYGGWYQNVPMRWASFKQIPALTILYLTDIDV